MRRMLTIAFGAALVATLSGSAIAADPPPAGTPLPSPQSPYYQGSPSSQAGLPGSAASNVPGLPPLPGEAGATNPDGSPMTPTGPPAREQGADDGGAMERRSPFRPGPVREANSGGFCSRTGRLCRRLGGPSGGHR